MVRHLWPILDLAGGDRGLRPDVAYTDDQGHLWRVLDESEVGCALCVDEPDVATLVHLRDDSVASCMRHGDLIEIPYLAVSQHVVKIGEIERSGEERVEDSILFPSSLSKEEVRQLILSMLEEAEASSCSADDK